MDHNFTTGTLLAGVVLSICAALLWTTSGFIQFAYQEEKYKAMYITLQWILTSSGSTVGALIAFGAKMTGGEQPGVSSAVYIAFIVVMTVAIVGASIFIIDPGNVVRDDGRHIATFEKATVKREVLGVLSVITDPKIIIILPAMFVAEMCLAMTSNINAYYFNIRTRTLNNVLFQAIMISTPLLLGYILNNEYVKPRKLRGVMGTTFVALITMGATCSLLAWIMKNQVNQEGSFSVDWTDSSFAAGLVLYILFGIVYGCFQLFAPATPVHLKGMSFRDQIIMQLALYLAGIFGLYYAIIVYVRQTNYFVEEGVIVPTEMENTLEQGEE
ncbi:MFS general substrate transporter [Aspergillus affinis]|uniref:MFS general substrate transporter n=1 Tax=Aspergillus affinis TaxID=1070780 RepID=UPI0022FE6133|nr:MFS general substrate transporter [Aspergillus affinis]KAI9037605.1 MFS general substrate transporter [Aspergillus affinis]